MRTILTVSLLLLACVAPAQSQVTDAFKLIGPVKTARLEIANVTTVNGQSVEGPRVLVELLSLDERGKLTEQTVKNADGSIKRKHIWKSTYDAAGKLTKQQFYNERGVQTCVADFTPDETGRISEGIFYCPKKINHREAYFYDDKGNKIRQVHTNRRGATLVSIVFVYENGRLTEETHYAGDGTLRHRNTHVYDDQGNKREFLTTDADGGILIKMGMSYSADSRGKPAELVRYNRSNVVITRETFTYEFDSHGNWIKRNTIRECFQKEDPTRETEVTYRTLTYYP